jgi:hypothetical protein
MAVASETRSSVARGLRASPRPPAANSSGRRRTAYRLLISLAALAVALLVAEAAFRLFWNPKYWIHTNRWLIGSGQTEAGKKWWPDTTYLVESSEFRVDFRTNGQGYRARLGPVVDERAFRIAFVGDSFTEGMQVACESTFCARLERMLNQYDPSRRYVCENDGVSATDLVEYWHRIAHDVFAGDPPDALVLCIYPGNDFQCVFPDEAFDRGDRPLREYYTKPTWTQHLIAWVNLHWKFGCYLQRAILSIGSRPSLRPRQGPKNWWADPSVAAQAAGAPAVRRSRSLLFAIDEECHKHGTKLCMLVVGPVANYAARNGTSPLARILADWKLDIPVIDIAIKARERADRQALIFPIDGHLTEAGHQYIAAEAAPALHALLAPAGHTKLR